MQILFFVGVIPFFVLRFLFKVTKKQKISCHVQTKCGFFIQKINKQEVDFFVFGHFDQETKNEKWNEPDKS